MYVTLGTNQWLQLVNLTFKDCVLMNIQHFVI
jgi:hypothetical protein